MISSSLDQTVKQWDFFRNQLLRTFEHDFSIESLCYNRMNDLVAFASSELSIVLLNARTGLKKVREFEEAANNKITDICFS